MQVFSFQFRIQTAKRRWARRVVLGSVKYPEHNFLVLLLPWVVCVRREGSMRHIVVLLYVCFTVGNLSFTGMDYLFFRWRNDSDYM